MTPEQLQALTDEQLESLLANIGAECRRRATLSKQEGLTTLEAVVKCLVGMSTLDECYDEDKVEACRKVLLKTFESSEAKTIEGILEECGDLSNWMYMLENDPRDCGSEEEFGKKYVEFLEHLEALTGIRS